MVTKWARYILVNTKVDPKRVAGYWNIPEEECWDYISDFNRALNEQDKLRNEALVKQEARDWAESLLDAYETKRQILLERLKNATTEEEKKQRLTHYKLFTNKISSLSTKQIERARNYPLKDLIGTNRNIVRCPFHDDRTASLNIKNNFFHCHGCGVNGDTIDFLVKRDGISFKEAILKLT